jgi:hypothetical protein
MIKNFLHIYKAIYIVMTISKNKAFKDKKLLIIEEEIIYLKSTLNIIEVFVKATNKLQGQKYPTIFYTIPLVYNIYNNLEKLRDEFKVNKFIIIILLKQI